MTFVVHIRNQQKVNSYETPAHGIYRSVKRFLLPIKLDEITIMMRSWNIIIEELEYYHSLTTAL